jgi:hypothetical protein
MPANTDVSSAIVRSLIPARMDRLPWTRFPTRLVMPLGTAWILDGLEITLASSVAGILTAPDTFRRHRDPGPAGADAESSLLAQTPSRATPHRRPPDHRRPQRTLRAIPRLTSEDSMTIHACRYLAARGKHRAKDQASPDQHHTPGPRIHAGSRSEAERRHTGQRPDHPVRTI